MPPLSLPVSHFVAPSVMLQSEIILSSSSCFPAEGQSLLVPNGAFFDLHIALDVVNCVRRLHIHCGRFASHRFHEYRERRSTLRYHGLMRDHVRYGTNYILEPTHARWDESCRKHTVLTMSCQPQVKSSGCSLASWHLHFC